MLLVVSLHQKQCTYCSSRWANSEHLRIVSNAPNVSSFQSLGSPRLSIQTFSSLSLIAVNDLLFRWNNQQPACGHRKAPPHVTPGSHGRRAFPGADLSQDLWQRLVRYPVTLNKCCCLLHPPKPVCGILLAMHLEE